MYSKEKIELSTRILERLGEYETYSLYSKQTKQDFIDLFLMLAVEQVRLDQPDLDRLMLLNYLDKVKSYPSNMIWIKQNSRKVGIMKQNLSKYLKIPSGAFINVFYDNLVDVDVVIKKFGINREQLDAVDTTWNTEFWRLGTKKYPFYSVKDIIHNFPKIIGNWTIKEKEFNEFIPVKDRIGSNSYVHTNAWKDHLKLAYKNWANKHDGIPFSYETTPFSKRAHNLQGAEIEIKNNQEVNRI